MILSSLVKSSPSILLAFDKVPQSGAEAILEQIDEVKKYYRFGTISEFVDRRKGGTALLVFENARKGAFLQIIPVLVADKIPFTLFLRPECIGTNRLPSDEEDRITREEYPGATAEALLSDPLDYFVTWGKIRQLPPESFGIGVNLQGRKVTDLELKEDFAFIETQMGRRAEVALCEANSRRLETLGIRAVVTAREGVIEASTSLFDLPRYRLKNND